MGTQGVVGRQPEEGDDVELTVRGRAKYRRLVERLNYIAQGRQTYNARLKNFADTRQTQGKWA